jgi:hypothetical protein
MRDASICGLGQAAPNPVDCVVQVLPARTAAMNAATRREAAPLGRTAGEFRSTAAP